MKNYHYHLQEQPISVSKGKMWIMEEPVFVRAAVFEGLVIGAQPSSHQ